MKLIIIIFCLFLNLHFCFADDLAKLAEKVIPLKVVNTELFDKIIIFEFLEESIEENIKIHISSNYFKLNKNIEEDYIIYEICSNILLGANNCYVKTLLSKDFENKKYDTIDLPQLNGELFIAKTITNGLYDIYTFTLVDCDQNCEYRDKNIKIGLFKYDGKTKYILSKIID